MLDGASAGANANGLTFIVGDNTVEGLIIKRFKGHGILFAASGGFSNIEVAGNDGWGIFVSGGNLFVHRTVGDMFAPSTVKVNANGMGGIRVELGAISAERIRDASIVLEVVGNIGPGIQTLKDFSNSLGIVKVLNNEGPGIDVKGALRLGGLGTIVMQVNGNQGTGISVGGPAIPATLLAVDSPLEVSDNCGWGISVVGKETEAIQFFADVKVNVNGTRPGCQGGGIRLEQGAIKVTRITDTQMLEVVGNNGPGIQTLTPFSNALGPVKVLNNQGTGIEVEGDLFLDGSLSSAGSVVNCNRGDGIDATGDVTIINGEVCGNGGEDIVAGGEFNPQNVIFGDVCTSVCGFAVDCPTPPFTIMAGILEEVTITGIGFDDAEGVVDSVQVQRSGPPADVFFNVVSNGRISVEIIASPKGKLPRLQTLIVQKSEGSKAICEDGVEVLP